MSKSIKVSEENYHKIQALLRPRETYSDVITRLISTFEAAGELLIVIEGGLRYQESRRAKLEETAPAH